MEIVNDLSNFINIEYNFPKIINHIMSLISICASFIHCQKCINIMKGFHNFQLNLSCVVYARAIFDILIEIYL